MNKKQTETRGVTSRRPIFFLALGALVGVVLAAAGLLSSARGNSRSMPADAVARVNGQIIRRADYERLLQALANDRRDGIDEEQRRHVLDRLIEEELLIQRGLELGFAYHDSRVRKDLTVAMIDSVVADYRDLQPEGDDLRRFYDTNRGFFTPSGRLRVRQVWCRAATLADAPAAYERARTAAVRLRAGDPLDVVRRDLGDPEVAPLPDALLPPSKLSDYLGPTALRAVLRQDTGGVTDPIRSSSGYHVLQLVERAAATAPPFEEVRSQALAELRRRAADDALRNYLDDLRARAEVEIVPALP